MDKVPHCPCGNLTQCPYPTPYDHSTLCATVKVKFKIITSQLDRLLDNEPDNFEITELL